MASAVAEAPTVLVDFVKPRADLGGEVGVSPQSVGVRRRPRGSDVLADREPPCNALSVISHLVPNVKNTCPMTSCQLFTVEENCGP